MKYYVSTALICVLLLSACSEEPTSTQPPTTLTPILKVNIQPDSLDGWLYYSFDLDSIIPASQSNTDIWDVKLRYLPYDTTASGIGNFINVFLNTGPIYFNSGTVNPNGKTKVAIIDSIFDQLSVVPQESLFLSDDTSSAGRAFKTLQYPNTIFIYSGPPNHACTFKPNKTVVLRSRSNKYYKVQFLSIYKDAPEQPNTKTELGYYRFRYIKADGTRLK
ncbi:hypothetical protein MASR2M18_07390 [Ignavibacteria bacterium]|nr:HmuY family protein [Bacteroidota bacterium]MCZ2132710.1 HmuY family protein [Bacteroidota bacterium]